MIDLHTHTLFSDGILLPSELVRYAVTKRYTAIGITDHVDMSNIDFVLPRIIKAAKSLSRHWNISVIPGVEITHVPIQEIGGLVRFARKNGARLVIVHGETVSEPVVPGTNREAIKQKADILAHPGHLTREEAVLAAKNKVHIEITTRKSHRGPNKKVIGQCLEYGAGMVLNTDTHTPDNLITDKEANRFLRNLGLSNKLIAEIFTNSSRIVSQKKFDFC